MTELAKKNIRQNRIGLTGLILILAVNFFVLQVTAFRGFNFFDYGAFLDASWRIFKGQRPYIDFYYTTGPIHLYLNAFFFLLFGFGKTALLVHIVAVSSAGTIAVFFATRRKIPIWLCLSVTALSAATFCWSLPHPWYDHSAYLWGIFAICVLILNLPFENQKQAFWSGVIAGTMSVLSFMTKTNIGAAYGVLFFVVFLYSPKRIKALLGFCAGIFVCGLVMLILIRSPLAYFNNTFMNYGSGATIQMLRLYLIPVWAKNYFWVPVLIVLYNFLDFRKTCRELFALVIGIYFVAIFAINTGSLRTIPTYSPLMGAMMAGVFVLFYQYRDLFRTKKEKWIRKISIVILTLGIFGLIAASSKYSLARAKNSGPLFSAGTYALRSGPFKGWLLNKNEGVLLDQMVNDINQKIPKNESLLILADMQILYALTGRDSYRGIPFIFTLGVVPAPGEQQRRVHDHILSHPPDWIFTNHEKSRYPLNPIIPYLGLNRELADNYRLYKTWGNYALFKRRG